MLLMMMMPLRLPCVLLHVLFQVSLRNCGISFSFLTDIFALLPGYRLTRRGKCFSSWALVGVLTGLGRKHDGWTCHLGERHGIGWGVFFAHVQMGT